MKHLSTVDIIGLSSAVVFVVWAVRRIVFLVKEVKDGRREW